MSSARLSLARVQRYRGADPSPFPTLPSVYLIHWPLKLTAPEDDKYNKFPKNADGSRATDLNFDISKAWAELEEIYERTGAFSELSSGRSEPICRGDEVAGDGPTTAVALE
jgi:hypothetical protein